MSRPNEARPDLYARVTNAIIADLEAGVRPWTKPWSADHLAGQVSRPLRHNGVPYSGVNAILLWTEATTEAFLKTWWPSCAAFLCADLDLELISTRPCRLHRQLVKVLNEDKRFIVTAATHAQWPYDLLHDKLAETMGRQPELEAL